MPVDQERLREELRRMRTLIEKDPATLARFDKDGDGVIDGYEWDQVRQLVIRRLEREEAQEAHGRRLAAEAGEDFAGAAAAPGAVAQAIYDGDLPAHHGSAAAPGSIAEADEMVLEQQGGLGRVLTRMVRRNYAVFATDGSPLGSVEQIENEMLQDLGNTSLLKVPDLHFSAVDAGTGTSMTFRRTEGLAREGIDVIDQTGCFCAAVDWKLSLLGRKFVVRAAGQPGEITVKGSIFHPLTLEILNLVDRQIGRIERGWSGLGSFLTGGNRMRIRVSPGEVGPAERWGLLAAALLADLCAESNQ